MNSKSRKSSISYDESSSENYEEKVDQISNDLTSNKQSRKS